MCIPISDWFTAAHMKHHYFLTLFWICSRNSLIFYFQSTSKSELNVLEEYPHFSLVFNV